MRLIFLQKVTEDAITKTLQRESSWTAELGCFALDIVTLIITMQLMVKIEDVVPGLVISPSMQVK
jgi:hypothetical protein